jgi:hypothetical protein
VTTRKDAYITGRRMLESELGAENMREVLHGDDQHAKTERLAYLAPEHFYPMGHRPLGTTDQYMLGLILYHVIRHKAPQTIDEESIEKVKAGEYPRFLRLPLLSDVTPECPRVLAEVVARMTQHDPKDRYRHIEDALFEVRGCLPIHLALVEESLARLTRDPEDERRFFEAFYEQLIESDAGIRRLFEARLGSQKDPRRQPGWRLQQRKLKDSVLALIAYARRVPTNDDTNPLFRVAQAHATTYRVEAGWYDAFMEAFVKTMRAKEEETLARRQTAYTVSPLPVLEQAWRQMLHAGILYMSKHGVADASCPRGEAPPPDHGGSPARAPRRAPRARRRA